MNELEIVLIVQRYHRMGRAIYSHNDEFEERITTNIGRFLTGRGRMNAYKDRIVEKKQVKEIKRARVERAAGDVSMKSRNEKQMTDRHAVASDEDESQHDENRMRDIFTGKRASETAKRNNQTN